MSCPYCNLKTTGGDIFIYCRVCGVAWEPLRTSVREEKKGEWFWSRVPYGCLIVIRDSEVCC
jgi:hypothetical protein